MDKIKVAELSKEIFIALISKIDPMHLGEFDTLKNISNVDKANNIFNSIYNNISSILQK